jgi:hypothetical protein
LKTKSKPTEDKIIDAVKDWALLDDSTHDLALHLWIEKERWKLPLLKDFTNYLVKRLPADVSPEWTKGKSTKAAKAKYESFIAQDWHDGMGNPILNWKSKAFNTVKADKHWNYAEDDNPTNVTPIRQSFAEQNAQAKKDILAKNMKSCS